MPEALYYLEQDAVLYLRAEGHITAGLCADLREIVFARLETQTPVKAMYVDLSACDYMDSTFLGLLVGFNKRLSSQSRSTLIIVQPTQSARELLTGLGLTSLVTISDVAVAFPSGLENIVNAKPPSAELLIKAHENLMELSDENRRRFAALHSVLISRAGKTEE